MKLSLILVVAGIILLGYGMFVPSAIVNYTPLQPTGQFYINGERATETSVHSLTSSVIQFEFRPTDNADQIKSCYVALSQGEGAEEQPVLWLGTSSSMLYLSLDSASGYWKISGELPKAGTYHIVGGVTSKAGLGYKYLSISIPWNVPGTPIDVDIEIGPSWLNWYTIAGGVLVAIGFILKQKKR